MKKVLRTDGLNNQNQLYWPRVCTHTSICSFSIVKFQSDFQTEVWLIFICSRRIHLSKELINKNLSETKTLNHWEPNVSAVQISTLSAERNYSTVQLEVEHKRSTLVQSSSRLLQTPTALRVRLHLDSLLWRLNRMMEAVGLECVCVLSCVVSLALLANTAWVNLMNSRFCRLWTIVNKHDCRLVKVCSGPKDRQ